MPIHPAADIFPMLPEAELSLLATDIQERGQLQPILVYQGKILDGRNRIAACKRAGVKPQFKEVDGLLRRRGISPLEFVVATNVRRRQLRPGQQALAAAAALPEWVKESRSASNSNLLRGRIKPERAKIRGRGRSDERLAKLFGISARYIRLAAELRREAPELAAGVMRGDCTLSRAVRQLRSHRRREKETEDLQRAGSGIVELYAGDFRTTLPQDRHYELILTDPPYYREALPLWRDLAQLANTRLTPGGYLAVMSGIQHLDQVMSVLGSPEYKLKYYWTLCVAWDGAHSRRHALRVINSWRPVVVMFKEPFRAPPQAVLDRFSATSPLVSSHPMQQRSTTFGHLVKDFSRPGDWVIDPFAGSGAVLEASRELGRNAVGCELHLKTVRLIEKRLRVKRVT